MVTSARIRLLLLYILCLVLVALFAGCGGGGGGGTPPPGGGGDVTAPTITGPTVVLPGDWSFLGGNVTIRATVTDAVGVDSVKANVTPTIGEVSLSRVGSSSTYQRVVSIAPNLTVAAIRYTVAVSAKDVADNSRSVTITFDIPSGDAPPPPPL